MVPDNRQPISARQFNGNKLIQILDLPSDSKYSELSDDEMQEIPASVPNSTHIGDDEYDSVDEIPLT